MHAFLSCCTAARALCVLVQIVKHEFQNVFLFFKGLRASNFASKARAQVRLGVHSSAIEQLRMLSGAARDVASMQALTLSRCLKMTDGSFFMGLQA